MNLYIWRHCTAYSSLSMLEEPKICEENYMRAEVCVLANTEKEALELLEMDGKWIIGDLKQIDPEIIELEKPRIVNKLIQ